MSMKEEEQLCQAFSEALLAVQDVDEQDADLPQLCSQYVKDIYDYLHVLEVTYSLNRSRGHWSRDRRGHRVTSSSPCFHRCSRPCEPTTCRVMKSQNACGLCSSTGWSRFTPDSSCCRRRCTSRSPSWIAFSR